MRFEFVIDEVWIVPNFEIKGTRPGQLRGPIRCSAVV